MPAYLFAGLPVHQAIATNKLSAGCGLITAVIRFYKNRLIDVPLALAAVPAALIGAVIGARLVLMVNEKTTEYMLVGALVIAAYYTLKKKKVESAEELPRKRVLLTVLLISFVIGGYDGFYGPGAGTFLILAYNSLAKMDIKTAAGNAKVINLSSNLASLTVFLLSGKVWISLGLAAALFSIAGSYIGSGLVIRRGAKIVRPIIIVVLILLFIKVIAEF